MSIAGNTPATIDNTRCDVVRHVWGHKGDTAATAVNTTQSQMAYLKGIMTKAIAIQTALNGVKVVTKTATCNAQGGGAGKVVDLFTLTGTTYIESIIGEVTEATNSTTFTNLLLHVFPAGGAGDDITATGTDYAGVAVGDMLIKTAAAATALTWIDISTAVLQADGAPVGCFVAKQNGAVTKIQAEYTSDASTDVDIKWTIRYRPISADGAIAAA